MIVMPRVVIAVAWVMALSPSIASAQTAPVPAPETSVVKPKTIEEPEYKRETPQPEITELPARDGAKRLSDAPKVFVKKFRVTGVTVFSEEEIAKVTAPYVNRDIGFEEMEEARRALTLLYVNRGYINSGAVIPDQKVEDGLIQIRVVEGKLTHIDVVGAGKLRPDYVSGRVALGVRDPLNMNDLQNSLVILQQNPLIKKINAELKPGLVPGESELKVNVAENPPDHLWARCGNTQSPSVGSERGEIQYANFNLSGHGDTLDFRFGRTISLTDFELKYDRPLTADDASIGFVIGRNNSTVIEAPFQDLEIASQTETYGLSVSRPFYRTADALFSMDLALENRHGYTYILGRSFSFSESSDNGHTAATVIRFKQNFTDRGRAHVVAARSALSWGLDAMGATIKDGVADGRFFAWLGQFQWARRFSDAGSQFVFGLNAQLARDPLLPMEKFAIGGMTTVRGYRENLLVRDNGLTASLEFMIPVFRHGDGLVHAAPFAQYGRSWNTRGGTPEPDSIYSAGAGVIWDMTKKTRLQAYYGYPLVKIEHGRDSLQEKGFHFLLTSELY